MYLSYYELKRSPFQITSDPRFLWLGETHREALATLKYGIYEDKSFVMLTGDVGCGKTTLINSFVKQLREEKVLCAVLSDPGLSLMDLFNHIAFLFGLNHNFKSKGEFIIAFSRFLNNAHDARKRVLLIIDEAQRIHAELLEEICMLSNIERENAKLINIFFVGQNEFREMVARHTNQSLRQKLTLSCQVTTLDKSDLAQYIRHRLKIAGTIHSIFSDKALSIIYNYSGGNPRITNIICDLALLTGFVQEKKKVDDKVILECVEELQLQPVVTEGAPAHHSASYDGEKDTSFRKEEGRDKIDSSLEEDVENDMELPDRKVNGKVFEKVSLDVDSENISDSYESSVCPEKSTSEIRPHKDETSEKMPAKKHLKYYFGNDRQIVILLGLLVIVLFLIGYILFHKNSGL